TGSLTFAMKPNGVRDLTNHFVLAGAPSNNTDAVAGINFAAAQELGTLGLGSTRTEFGQTDPIATDATSGFTLASAATVSASLAGLIADANVFIVHDELDPNGNPVKDGLYDNFDEIDKESFQPGTSDEGLAVTLAPGRYYAWVYNVVHGTSTPYTLT